MTRSSRSRRAGLGLAAGLALAVAAPAAATASPVLLGTADQFVVLGATPAVTNTGPSVLNGDLGISPAASLTGFGPPAVVNGAQHAADAVANTAQNDLTTAYTTAAGQPVAPADDLTGTNLGNRTLNPGAYRYTSSAQLTGQLTLDAHGDPSAQWVFEIGSALTTASASSVKLINGASPCNIFWQVGSSATLGTTTDFAGNILALSDISAATGATVLGRLLARNGAVTLDTNTLTRPDCTSGPTTQGGTPPSGGGTTTPSGTAQSGPTEVGNPPVGKGAPPTVAHDGTTTFVRRTFPSCTAGFRATVRGKAIRAVTFRLDGKRVAARTRSPFSVYVRAAAGRHRVTAKVTFTDARRAKTLELGYRVCAAAVLRPQPGPSRFAG